MTNRLRELRTQRGLSLRGLAEAINLDFSSLAYYERGVRNFSSKSQKILADYFGVSVDYLLGYSLQEIYDRFVDTHYGDFIDVDIDLKGDAYEKAREDIVMATKFEIIRAVNSINDKATLDDILSKIKKCQADTDFGEV